MNVFEEYCVFDLAIFYADLTRIEELLQCFATQIHVHPRVDFDGLLFPGTRCQSHSTIGQHVGIAHALQQGRLSRKSQMHPLSLAPGQTFRM